MQLNLRFIAHGAILAFIFLAMTASLDDVNRLAIVMGLCATAILVERVATKR